MFCKVESRASSLSIGPLRGKTASLMYHLCASNKIQSVRWSVGVGGGGCFFRLEVCIFIVTGTSLRRLPACTGPAAN